MSGWTWRKWLRWVAGGLAVAFLVVGLLAGGALVGARQVRHLVQEYNADLNHIVSPTGIDEASYVAIGGVRQWVTMRGQDHDQPALVFLHGGPGGALADMSYTFQRPWEDYFVVVQWDQRGFGRSNIDADKIAGTTTKERYIADTIELIDYVRQHLHVEKVILVGQSWGTLLGAEVVHRRPDLLYAFVAFGQLTGWESSYEGIRQNLIALARDTHDAALERQMQALGPVPISATPPPFFAVMDPVWAEMNRRGYSWHSKTGSTTPLDDLFLAATVMSPSVTDHRLWQLMRGAAANNYYDRLHPTVSGWSLERDVGINLAVPYIVVMGKYDWQTPVNLARDYYHKVCAPFKVYVELPNSAHVAILEEPGRALSALVDFALPAAQREVPPGVERCAAAPTPSAALKH